MKRAIVSPILSGLVIPGLGQLVNRQIAKGAFLVAAVSLLFMITLGFTFHQLSKAVIALEGTQAPDKFAALREQLVSQGVWWLFLLGGLLAGLWLYGVIDAWRWGRLRDLEDQEG